VDGNLQYSWIVLIMPSLELNQTVISQGLAFLVRFTLAGPGDHGYVYGSGKNEVSDVFLSHAVAPT
jgi:hypothetical protein